MNISYTFSFFSLKQVVDWPHRTCNSLQGMCRVKFGKQQNTLYINVASDSVLGNISINKNRSILID